MRELAIRRVKQSEVEVDLGLRSEQVPLHSHVVYLWESDQEFADAVAFLKAGLRGKDHCVIFGHQEANETVCKILRAGGFDVDALLSAGRLTVLSGQASADGIL